MKKSPEDAHTAGPHNGRWNIWLGIGVLAFVAICLLVWFPRDIGSGFLEKNLTGRIVPGDSFFPVVLVGLMVPLALLLLFSQISAARKHVEGELVGHIGAGNLVFLMRATFLIAVSLLMMKLSGPALVWFTNALGISDHSGYRAVSATFPYSVFGFFLGGTLLTCGFIQTIRHRLTPFDVLISAVTTLVLILIFNGLLDDIQLPPNADL